MAERITGHTELIGLMAYPIRHSSSPAMQNEAFAKLGYDYAYLAFEVGADEIEDAVKAIRTLKMRGSNVSMPNKTLVGQYLDELSPAAELCGAVNTIVNDNGHLTGHITDGIGFMQSLKDNNIDVIGKKMTIVGAGGAATAIEIQAALDGVSEIVIFNRKDEFWDRAVSTVEKINTRTSSHAVLYDLADLDKLKEEMDDSYLFVNATGVGMKPLEGQSVADRCRCSLFSTGDKDAFHGKRSWMQDYERSGHDAVPGICCFRVVDRRTDAYRTHEISSEHQIRLKCKTFFRKGKHYEYCKSKKHYHRRRQTEDLCSDRW